MADGYTEADRYGQVDSSTLMALMSAYSAPLPPPEPVKLTLEQWEEVKALAGAPAADAGPFGPTGLAPLLGVPIHIVDCVEDSTPYKRRPRPFTSFDKLLGPGY